LKNKVKRGEKGGTGDAYIGGPILTEERGGLRRRTDLLSFSKWGRWKTKRGISVVIKRERKKREATVELALSI